MGDPGGLSLNSPPPSGRPFPFSVWRNRVRFLQRRVGMLQALEQADRRPWDDTSVQNWLYRVERELEELQARLDLGERRQKQERERAA